MVQWRIGVAVAVAASFAAVSFGVTARTAMGASAFAKSTPALVEKGKAAFTTNCVSCHGDKLDGNGPAGAMMTPKPRNLVVDKFKSGDKPDKVLKTVTDGMTGTAMTGFAHLSEEDRWSLVHYILSERKAKKK